ncbi:MAG: 2-succinyl-5-enolpyruvyl-6-hydroxy-3-cyclohexene-1-carboxylic-acid synthase [Acidimicrobiales bacterium]
MNPAPVDPVYDVIAAFAAGLVEHGVTDVVVSPGSRSTPLSLTLHAQPALRTWIQIDERSAGFFAVGQAKMTGRPSVLVCTSGTAAANYLPAVVEANRAGVPLIVCTADRPPELRGWGAGQTIDQVGLFTTNTRWAADLPVAGEWSPAPARLVAHRAVDAATGARPGPVHLNWPLREPLEPIGGVPVVEAVPVSTVSVAAPAAGLEIDSRYAAAARVAVVVGPDAATSVDGQRTLVDAINRVAARHGWVVIGEPISGVRRSADHGAVRVAHADQLLKIDEIAQELRPDLVLRFGGSPTTKPVRQWLERHSAPLVLVDEGRRWNDASFTLATHLGADPLAALAALDEALSASADPAWAARWSALDTAAAGAVTAVVEGGALLSAAVTRTLADTLPAGTLVMTSNSMPVRDLDAFVPLTGPAIDFVGNRGASGIDGITSTALGLASAGDAPVVLYTGDLALLHDLGALFGARRVGVHLTVVCVDNDGGGIFSLLPIAGRPGSPAAEGPGFGGNGFGADDFETLFRTRHGLDLAAFSGIGGVTVTRTSTAAELRTALVVATRSTEPGVDVVLVEVDRDADVAQRREIGAAVRAAVR